MNTSFKGNTKELRSAELLTQEGWLVASRRHLKGPGDLLAVSAHGGRLLLEVKATANGPYDGFGRADRLAMLEAQAEFGVVPALAWWPRAAKTHTIIMWWEWPKVHAMLRELQGPEKAAAA